MEFRRDIEGLRAIAILLVVAYHAQVPGFSGGYIGVDVFFVLSGYLITGLLVHEVKTNGFLDLPGFYARRARRLLPAMALMMVGTIALGAAIYSPPEQTEQTGSALSTAAYVSNLYFAAEATNYNAPDAKLNPFLHTWSLSVEEQFYLAWPLLIMIGLGRKNQQQRLFRCILAAAVLSYLLSTYLTTVRQPWAFFSSPTRAWEFAIGAMAALLPNEKRLGRMGGWVGLGGILISAIAFDEGTPFPGSAAFLPALASVMVLRGDAPVLTVAPLQYLGRVSYSWYLWHWPVLVLGARLIEAPSLSARLAMVCGALFIAGLSYRYIEHPIRRSEVLARRHAYSLGMAAVLAITTAGLSLAWGHIAERASATRISQARADAPVLHSANCFANYYETAVLDCAFGPENAEVEVVLFGDSHAAAWFPAVEAISQQRGWRLIPITKSWCAEVDSISFQPAIGRLYTECMEWRKAALSKIREIRPALVLIGSSSGGHKYEEAERFEATLRVLDELSRASGNVVILRDPPIPNFDVPDCLARAAKPCQFTTGARSAPEVYEVQRRASARFRNVATVDLTPAICPDVRCAVERDGMILYRDTNHLTATFSRSLAPKLSVELGRILDEKRSGLDSNAAQP